MNEQTRVEPVCPKGMEKAVVCLLAHNEEKCIRQTVLAILRGNSDFSPKIKVYLNGCTDRSLEIVEELAAEYEGVEAIVIEEASKVKTWNRAFIENEDEILFFGDGDVIPERGAISELFKIFTQERSVELACCTTTPMNSGVLWQQKVVGMLQIPLRQNFLIGHFYALRRKEFIARFQEFELTGIPEGLVGEDAFLDRLTPHKNFQLAKSRVFYEPPIFDDYFRYLGRLRWQNEQIDNFFEEVCRERVLVHVTHRARFIEKIRQGGSFSQLLLGGSTTLLRILFKKTFAGRINAAYKSLGPVVKDGAWILSRATRSDSVK